MAASNYYGFAAGAVAGPQYSAQPAPAYTHPPTVASYTIQQTPGVDHTMAPAYAPATQAARPMASAAYGGYQAHAAQDYGYGARQPEPTPQLSAAQNYQDGYSYGRSPSASSYETKPYYPAVVTQSQHPATDSYYHSNSQSTYSQPTAVYGQSQPQRQVTPIKPVQTVNAPLSAYSTYPTVTTGQQNTSASSIHSYTPSSSSYNSSSYNTSAVSYSGSSYSTYDAAAGYPAANASYYQPAQQPLVQQQHQQPPPQQQPPPAQPPKPLQGSLWSSGSNPVPSGGYSKKPLFPPKLLKPKGPPKQPQLHYCEICKISCAGPQTYREHLEGQKHKKKEMALKTGNQAAGGPRGIQTQLFCELCDVSCTGADAYAAHIRGAKHQKVVKLHTKLGKPIPSIEPVVVNSSSGPANGSASKQTLHATTLAKQAPGITNSALGSNKASPAKKPVAVTKLTFTGASKLQGTPAKQEAAARATSPKVGLPVEQLQLDGDSPGELLDVHPVGYDYVEEVHNEEGKMIRFHCKLCECSFNDPNAKDMHLKGRRHRIQYKKKVNPDLPVEIKPSNRLRKLHEEKLLKKQQLRALVKRRREEEQRWQLEMRRYEEEMYWRRVEEEQLYWEEQRRRRLAADWRPPPLMGRPGVPVPPLLPTRRPDSSNDRHIMAKHSSIYPTEEELQAIQTVVSHSERALRLVSDWLTEQESGKEEGDKEPGKTDGVPRVLKGVMRVGILAKGLLLRGDRNVHLILLSAQKPTLTLLRSIAEQLPEHLGKVTKDSYEVVSNVEEASIVIGSTKEPKMQVTVSLTSPLVREEAPAADAEASPEPQLESSDFLDKQKCLESLAALRHAKWFQARANGLQSCVIIIRVLRDLCQRVPTWGALPDWAMELLVERALSSTAGPLGPGEAIRRVLECIATGMLLSDGPGLQDPCEKEATDVLQSMSQQSREDITASSQHALRMLAFRQIHKVLGMEPLPLSKSRLAVHGRKRRLDTDEETAGEGDGKKDKKEDEDDKA
ncbi:zinc finger RNA-binding protein-like isoform X2 [Sphaerodactylus townsendi]|uniref:zinc finger RNA-binding protein-like isoform X2 n=1 Tax=Sphaerodactylus townsendi TaxID=933632 RepID=UPI002026C0E4|nr:zinc finger RNA-binding protein-like isoform X2 [Sphaerodactylus townsendi]